MRTVIFSLLAFLFCNISTAADRMDDAAALELGYSIYAINEALQDPGAAGALQAITTLGHDQRHYVMVRGG